MNSLSWLLYFADVGVSIAAFTIFVGIISVTIGVVISIISYIPWTRYSYHSDSYWTQLENLQNNLKKLGPKTVLISFVFIFIAILVPSRQTIYMIAASEMGEKAYNSPEGQEVINNLKQIILELTKPKVSTP